MAVLKKLVLNPELGSPVTVADVKEETFRKKDFEDFEYQVVVKLANLFRPYTPKRWRNPTTGSYQDPIAHITLRTPFALIANAILQAAGYHEFTRRITPQISASGLQALQLGAVGMYEVFCAATPGHFDVNDAQGSPLTAYQDVYKSDNKRAVFEQFFNMAHVDSFCRSHGLEFAMRWVPVAKDR